MTSIIRIPRVELTVSGGFAGGKSDYVVDGSRITADARWQTPVDRALSLNETMALYLKTVAARAHTQTDIQRSDSPVYDGQQFDLRITGVGADWSVRWHTGDTVPAAISELFQAVIQSAREAGSPSRDLDL